MSKSGCSGDKVDPWAERVTLPRIVIFAAEQVFL